MPELNYFYVYGRDISKQKKNEAELFRLSLVASANENGVVFNNSAGQITWVNEAFCRLIGYNMQDVLGKNPLDFCRGPLTDELYLEEIKATIGIYETFDIELIHYRKDGSWFWGRVKGQAYRADGAGEIQYFAFLEDITEKKQNDERLKVLSQIAESNINAVIITDEVGKVTWVNKSFTEMTGYDASEVLGKKPGNLLQGPDTDPETIAYLRKCVSNGEPFNTEIYNYSKSGKPYWLRVQGQPIKDNNGKLKGFFALEENITREKQANDLIKQSEERFRLTLEKIGDNVWEHNFKTGKTVFSKVNNELWGYDNNDFIDDGMLWWVSVHMDDLHVLKDNYVQYKNGDIESHNLEYRIIHKDGTVKWVLDRGGVLEKDAAGKALRTIGTHTDITQIKHTEVELEQRVKQFKSLSENIPGVIYEYEFRKDGSEGIRYISPAIERVFGLKPDDFKNYMDYIHPQDRDRIKQKNEHAKKTLERFYDESMLLIPGQNARWHAVHSSFSYTDQNGANVFTGFMKDITERKNIEQKLIANEEKYRNIIANMELGLMEVDISGKVTYVNHSFCSMSGYDETELIGHEPIHIFHNERNGGLLSEKQQSRRIGISDAYELEVNHKNGGTRWWLISGGPRFNERAEFVGSTGIYLDITEKKKQERELIEARIVAENLAKTKEIFLANMSHEIRTPMNAIMGMSNQLSKTILSDKQKFYLDIIHAAADNLLVIINDILDLSKIEAGKLSIENIGFEPLVMVKKAIQVLTLKAEEKGLTISNSEFDPRISPVLLGDPYRITQVILNLLSNAIKFTEHGGVDVTVKLLADDIDSQKLRIQVKDSGIGMDAAFLERLFEKFAQEYESVSRNYGGTGLGMGIAKDLIELMGGDIVASSKKGVGTTVSFTLTLSKGTKANLPEKIVIEIEKDFLQGKRILVADDNEINILVAAVILQNHGAEIIQALNGHQAFEECVAKKPDLILMDIQMPGLNGYDSTKKIRAINNSIPIIALTANAIKGENEKCLEAGMNDYISKPFKEEDLLKTIATWLGKKVSLSTVKNEAVSAQAFPSYDLSALKEISRGNNSFVAKMVNMFCEQTPIMFADMIAAYRENDYQQVASIAHKIKPSIDNMNITELKDIILTIEKIGKRELKDNGLDKWLNEGQLITNRVIEQMRKENFD
jgi:PAS domain S-box-containing protein